MIQRGIAVRMVKKRWSVFNLFRSGYMPYNTLVSEYLWRYVVTSTVCRQCVAMVGGQQFNLHRCYLTKIRPDKGQFARDQAILPVTNEFQKL